MFDSCGFDECSPAGLVGSVYSSAGKAGSLFAYRSIAWVVCFAIARRP